MFHQARFEEALSALSVDDVNEAVRRHFDPDQISAAIAGDFDGD
jgi:predicted Zn-dependent peptidase